MKPNQTRQADSGGGRFPFALSRQWPGAAALSVWWKAVLDTGNLGLKILI